MNRRLILEAEQGPKIHVPQTSKLPGRESEMEQNSAGGQGFVLDPWDKLNRFLLIGSLGGTFYAKEPKLTSKGIAGVRECLKLDGHRVVQTAYEVLKDRRSAKPTFGIFVLALAASDEDVRVRQAALFRAVECIGYATHFFAFLDCLKTQRGLGGRAVRKFVRSWLTKNDADWLAFQMTKYQGREGWTWRDVLRLTRIPGRELGKDYDALFNWITGNVEEPWKIEALPARAKVFSATKAPGAQFDWPSVIREHRFSHEMVSNDVKKDPEVWRALVEDMPVWALLRNLGRMSALDMFPFMGSNDSLDLVLEQLDESSIVQSKIHPLQVLLALKQYKAGQGFRGNLTWNPNKEILHWLDGAFLHAFRNLKPTSTRTLIGIDFSGSMRANVNDTNLSVREAAVALSMCCMSVESKVGAIGFDTSVYQSTIHPKRTLSQNLADVPSHGSGTDCSLPLQFATQQGIEVDTFILFTDNETWAGMGHPAQWLDRYQAEVGIEPKFIVCAMTASKASICDPKDSRMLEAVGFDAALPQVIYEFVKDTDREEADRKTNLKTVVSPDHKPGPTGSTIILPGQE